jgi:hypothetical protein
MDWAPVVRRVATFGSLARSNVGSTARAVQVNRSVAARE